ncbi:DUF3332 domain-containing protein [Maribacter aestuarii]|uniref:DUF3332 domain-containing protein n=1 Tax=Maribacter aestuarii TaxID=1130723 RepID=UPI00248AE867|nr:DUF3332 domain-containing protein [Maribacter aestuarii]
MKKSIICVAMASSLLFTSCLGSFSAFNNLKEWNQNISDSKFVNNLVFWGLNIIPVYGLFFLGDTVIFNVIEFWSGSNPIAMEEGEQETQMVERDGNTFKMVASKNRMQVTVVDGPKTGKKIDLVYKPSEKSWNAIRPNGEIIKLSSFEEGFYIVYMPNGKEVKIDALSTREEGLALMKEQTDCYYMEGMLAENN